MKGIEALRAYQEEIIESIPAGLPGIPDHHEWFYPGFEILIRYTGMGYSEEGNIYFTVQPGYS